MNATILALTVGLGLLGILILLLGIFPAEEPTEGKFPNRFARLWARRREIFTRRVVIGASIGLLVGFILFLVSGWAITLLAGPVLAIAIPMLIGSRNDGEDIEKLQALETYTRNLAGMIVAGQGLEAALPATVRSAPPHIRPAIERVAARLTSRWTIEDTLRGLAKDLDDATGDLVVAHLQLAAKERGPGLAQALSDLADDVFEEVKARRQVAADRAKPQRTIRLITFITLGLLAGLPFFGAAQFFAVYGTPLGQVILAGWLAIYVVVLVLLRRHIRTRPMPRILQGG